MLRLFRRKPDDPVAEIKSLLGDFELRSFPSTVINVLGMLRNSDTTMSEIAGQIEVDPGLTVNVLRLVNSAGFGLAARVNSLQHAVSLLGRSRLESLLLTYAAADSLPDTMEAAESAAFWTASARRACLARVVAQHLHAGTASEAFTAGLLQDMGIPALIGAKGAEYQVILEKWKSEPGQRLDALERAAFGYDHATVGALMATEWGLPEYLVDAIGAHHDGENSDRAQPAVRLVANIGYLDEKAELRLLAPAAEAEFGIDGALLEEMVANSFSEAERLAEIFHH